MALRMGLISLALVVLAALLHGATADTHVVLGNRGWTIPNSPDEYTKWAANEDFEKGDSLVFNFPTQAHDVAEVTKAAYDSCDTNNPISIKKTGPVTINLTSNGNHYFICTIPTHCSLGQKLAISVGTQSGAVSPSGSVVPRTPGAVTPSGSIIPPPAPSSAPSVAVGSLFVAAVLFISMAFLH